MYDHWTDPAELNNLADQLVMGSILDSLQRALLQIDATYKVVPEGVGLVNPKAKPLPRVAPILKRPPLDSSEP